MQMITTGRTDGWNTSSSAAIPYKDPIIKRTMTTEDEPIFLFIQGGDAGDFDR